ncbi:hypothetical protein AK830_g11406 [Neonectria ditissima]|uniref:Uncharacterized protein n=1 Tax=Neonectria ditissima TaxID=78410 RepID=A0A0P7ARA6_9HYPO|nr:hypothetical protein AK830_g11406 [Neonectria ditissima]
MAPKKAKATAPSTKSIASPKSRRAPKRRASPMEELSPRIKRRATRAPTQDRDLDQESREADAKIPDFTSAMDNDHEGVVLQSRQSPRHEADSTKGHAQSTSGDQNQSSDQKHPGDQEELSDQKLVNPEQPIDQKPVKPEQSMDQEPVNQKQSMDQKPVNPEQPMDQKPVNPGQSMDQEPVNPEQPIDQKQPDDSPSPVHDKESTGNKPPDHRAPFYLDRIRNTPPFNEDEVYRFNRFADEIIVLDEYNHKKLKVDLDHRVAELVGGSTLIPWNQLNVDAQHKLEALGNNVESYVKSANCIHHGLVHTAFTWRVLFDNLLSPDCSEKWCGEFWTTYGTMLGQFRGK